MAYRESPHRQGRGALPLLHTGFVGPGAPAAAAARGRPEGARPGRLIRQAAPTQGAAREIRLSREGAGPLQTRGGEEPSFKVLCKDEGGAFVQWNMLENFQCTYWTNLAAGEEPSCRVLYKAPRTAPDSRGAGRPGSAAHLYGGHIWRVLFGLSVPWS